MKSKESPVEDGTRLISTLQRCSTNHPVENVKEEDTKFSQSEETMVDKSNASAVCVPFTLYLWCFFFLAIVMKSVCILCVLSDEPRKMGDEDSTLGQPGKTMNNKLNPRPLFANEHMESSLKRWSNQPVISAMIEANEFKRLERRMDLRLNRSPHYVPWGSSRGKLRARSSRKGLRKKGGWRDLNCKVKKSCHKIVPRV